MLSPKWTEEIRSLVWISKRLTNLIVLEEWSPSVEATGVRLIEGDIMLDISWRGNFFIVMNLHAFMMVLLAKWVNKYSKKY